MELVKYRDAGLNTYTWFWVDDLKNIRSPFFDTEDQAQEWMRELLLAQIQNLA
jgi:hypothetical protein